MMRGGVTEYIPVGEYDPDEVIQKQISDVLTAMGTSPLKVL